MFLQSLAVDLLKKIKKSVAYLDLFLYGCASYDTRILTVLPSREKQYDISSTAELCPFVHNTEKMLLMYVVSSWDLIKGFIIIIIITRPGAHTTKYNYHGANY